MGVFPACCHPGRPGFHHQTRMDSRLICSVVLLLTGAVGQSVTYPDPVCAVTGSDVTLPCTFTALRTLPGSSSVLGVVRVRWCQNHEICQGTTPSVYDSESERNNPRYRYLGDLKGNCTLQIRDVQKEDDAVLRFRMEATHSSGHFTERSGVKVTVIEGGDLRVNSSGTDPHAVTLTCTSACTLDPGEVTWFKDDHALSASGSALQLGPLTAKDSGNYSCAPRTNTRTRSPPFSLQVEEGSGEKLQTAAVVLGVLLLLSAVVLFLFLRRRQTAARKRQRPEAEDTEPQLPDHVYSSVLPPAGPDTRALDDTNYASIRFTHTEQTRCAEPEDAVVYTSVATRG